MLEIQRNLENSREIHHLCGLPPACLRLCRALWRPWGRCGTSPGLSGAAWKLFVRSVHARGANQVVICFCSPAAGMHLQTAATGPRFEPF